jgi:hypothetical protein
MPGKMPGILPGILLGRLNECGLARREAGIHCIVPHARTQLRFNRKRNSKTILVPLSILAPTERLLAANIGAKADFPGRNRGDGPSSSQKEIQR